MDINGLPMPNISHWILQTVAMLITALLLPGLRVSGPIPAFLTVLVLAFINSHIWDAALFFQIPDSLSMQMLVLLLSNGLIFWIVVKLLPGIEIRGIISATLAPILFTVTSIGITELNKNVDWKEVFKITKEKAAEVKEYVKDAKSSHHPEPESK